MLTVEAKVNGMLISHTRIVNMDEMFVEEACLYKYSHHVIGEGGVTQGELLHKRKDGHQKLIELVMKEIK